MLVLTQENLTVLGKEFQKYLGLVDYSITFKLIPKKEMKNYHARKSDRGWISFDQVHLQADVYINQDGQWNHDHNECWERTVIHELLHILVERQGKAFTIHQHRLIYKLSLTIYLLWKEATLNDETADD